MSQIKTENNWLHKRNKISFFIYSSMTLLSWLHSPSHIPHASPPLPSSLVSDYQYKNAGRILYDKSGGKVRSRLCRQEYQSACRTRCLLPICIKIERHVENYAETRWLRCSRCCLAIHLGSFVFFFLGVQSFAIYTSCIAVRKKEKKIYIPFFIVKCIFLSFHNF